MLGKREGRRRQGCQSMRWFDGITDSVDMNLGKLREMVKDRETWHAAVHGVAKESRMTEPLNNSKLHCGPACSVMSNSLQPHGLWPASLRCPLNFPSRNTGVDCHFSLQGIFPDPKIKPTYPASPALQVNSLLLNHRGSLPDTTQILKYSLICHILDCIELAKFSSIFFKFDV